MSTGLASWVGESLAAGRYQIVGQLGQGGMGTVYRARDRHLDADVVVKVPRAGLLEEPGFAGRFAREIRALVRLQHPHIVKVTDVGQHAGLPFAVMQYLAGGSLRDRQERQPDAPLPERLRGLADWLGGVAGALDFIHRQGLLHRDVKPDNILFDEHGHAYLGDFGVAKVLAEGGGSRTAVTGTGMVLGTPYYLAPEIIQGQPCDGRADQYALAVMVYELVSGRKPFDGPTAPAVFVKHMTEEPPPLLELEPALPRALAAAVHRALAKDARLRFPDCASFARAVLEAAAVATSGRPVTEAARPATSASVPCPVCGKPLPPRLATDGPARECPSCRHVLIPARPAAPGAGVPPPARETRPYAPVAGETASTPGRRPEPTPVPVGPPPVRSRTVAVAPPPLPPLVPASAPERPATPARRPDGDRPKSAPEPDEPPRPPSRLLGLVGAIPVWAWIAAVGGVVVLAILAGIVFSPARQQVAQATPPEGAPAGPTASGSQETPLADALARLQPPAPQLPTSPAPPAPRDEPLSPKESPSGKTEPPAPPAAPVAPPRQPDPEPEAVPAKPQAPEVAPPTKPRLEPEPAPPAPSKAAPSPPPAPTGIKLTAPRQTAPDAGAVVRGSTGRTRLEWETVPGAAGYVVEVQLLDRPTQQYRDWKAEKVKKPYLTVFAEVGRPYRWRVAAVDRAGAEGPKSEWRKFYHSAQ
jgi:serine/threonine-protein kinase